MSEKMQQEYEDVGAEQASLFRSEDSGVISDCPPKTCSANAVTPVSACLSHWQHFLVQREGLEVSYVFHTLQEHHHLMQHGRFWLVQGDTPWNVFLALGQEPSKKFY